MSYAAGLALGASLGKGIHDLLFEDYKPRRLRTGLDLVSKLPGRRRYRLPRLDSATARRWEEKLSPLPYIKSCAVNPLTGSLLLTFAPADERKIDALMASLSTASPSPQSPMMTVAKDSFREPPCGAQDLPVAPRAGKLTQTVRDLARDISDWLKQRTGGWFDISSLASVFFLVRGVRKMFLTGQRPTGSQMLWWALSLMRGWRTA